MEAEEMSMMHKIKSNLFTVHGLVTSILHMFLLVGVLCSWIFFNLQVLGNDIGIDVPSTEAIREKVRR